MEVTPASVKETTKVMVLESIKLKSLQDKVSESVQHSGSGSLVKKTGLIEEKKGIMLDNIIPVITGQKRPVNNTLAESTSLSNVPVCNAAPIDVSNSHSNDSTLNEEITMEPIIMKKPKLESGEKPEDVNIFMEPTGPEWYDVKNNLRTNPIKASNLPKVFSDLPLFAKPKNNAELPRFQDKLCQDFVGLSDEEYERQKKFCSIDSLLTGREMRMTTKRPTQGLLSTAIALREEEHGIIKIPDNPKLTTLKKLSKRLEEDLTNVFSRKLKYRGVRLMPLLNQEKPPPSESEPIDLAPGHDTLFRVRIYRPFVFSLPGQRRRPFTDREGNPFRGRHSVFNCDVMVLGRQMLSALRDRIACRNDLDLRLDLSQDPHVPLPSNSKASFPSNFMFVNNTFYVDTRPDCKDLTVKLRAFAEAQGMGSYEVRDMCAVTVGELNASLAYPEVYVHQGECEHVFQFSEVRLLSYADPLQLANYPSHAAASQHQTLYCNTCAEFSARWIVTGSERVPFDPAFFCEACFDMYMYVGARKAEDFRAYLYKGNEINMLRPDVAPAPRARPPPPLNQVRIDY